MLDVIYSVTPYTTDFGDVTIMDLTRTSSQRVNQGGSTKFNLQGVSRALRIYDNATDTYGSTYEATSRFCDYVFYQLHEVMGVPIQYIDTDSLFEIHDNLSDPQLGEFHFTFDDKNTSSRERIEVACNAARVRYYNDGLYWRFVREEARAVKSLSFNRRNLKPEAARYTQQFYKNNDYDGVTVVYVDPVTNSEARIHRKISGGAILSGESVYPLLIELGGCRNTLQATNRAELEVRRLIYQRVKVTDQAMNDALLARLGDRVDWVDMFDSEIFSGEILGISGNDYITSERFVPQPATTYYVYVTDDEGQPSNSVVATARADGNVFGFTATGLTGAYIKSGQIQLGSRYVIASNSDLNASSFVFNRRGRPDELGNCQIEMVEYNELMFEAD